MLCFQKTGTSSNSRKSIINVTKLDTVNNSIEGTFDLYFERDGKKNAQKPRKVCFEDGKFKMQYRKQKTKIPNTQNVRDFLISVIFF